MISKSIKVLFTIVLSLTIILILTSCDSSSSNSSDLILVNDYEVNITVIDSQTEERIAGAEVSLGDKTAITDANGLAKFNSVEEGQYSLSVTAEDYKLADEGVITVDSNSTNFVIQMDPIKITSEEYFTFDSSTGTIIDYDPEGGLDVVIPATINDINVVKIGDEAFMNKQLTEVSIPYGIEIIGEMAFRDNEINNLTLPDSIKSIGYQSFRSNKIKSLKLSKGMESTGLEAFRNNELTKLIIPENIIIIEEESFRRNHLREVLFEGTPKIFERRAFYQNQLESFEIPEGLKIIHEGALSYNKLNSVTIPDTITEMGINVFLDNEFTELPKLPVSITTLPAGIFYNNKITNIAMPDHITIIGERAFRGNNIVSISAEDFNNVTIIESAAFPENQISSLEFSTKITEVRDQAFHHNNLKSLDILENLVNIGRSAFIYNQLEELKIADDVEIDDYVFRENQLTKIIIGENVTLGKSLLTGEFGDPENNVFRNIYENQGAGIYIGEQKGSWTKVYEININNVQNGSANVTVNKTLASENELITITISEIEAGKQFKSIQINDGIIAANEEVAGEKYTFTMPAETVTVTIKLEQIPGVFITEVILTGGATIADRFASSNTAANLIADAIREKTSADIATITSTIVESGVEIAAGSFTEDELLSLYSSFIDDRKAVIGEMKGARIKELLLEKSQKFNNIRLQVSGMVYNIYLDSSGDAYKIDDVYLADGSPVYDSELYTITFNSFNFNDYNLVEGDDITIITTTQETEKEMLLNYVNNLKAPIPESLADFRIQIIQD